MTFRRPNPVFSEEYRALVSVVLQARRDAGLSQSALAERLGKAKSHICMIERGQRRVDALELYRMAKCLDLAPTELFRRIEERLDRLAAAGA